MSSPKAHTHLSRFVLHILVMLLLKASTVTLRSTDPAPMGGDAGAMGGDAGTMGGVAGAEGTRVVAGLPGAKSPKNTTISPVRRTPASAKVKLGC
mmetsp:Transcript_92958/g.113862  ORF Transcript_92958/g.113862 Transcript_92958/m.113862 type:complete len:95 (+) Transcript_92958:721-1005(+)